MAELSSGAVSSSSDDLPVDIVRALRRAIANRGLTTRPILTTKTIPALAQIVDQCHDILFNAKTVFPFDPFPDIVTLDREKVSITYRSFFFAAKIISIPVRDLLNVEADVGPFFGSLHMSSRYFATTPCTISFLKRQDALLLQRLLQGYIICEEQNIDTDHISKDQLIEMLNDLGSGSSRVIRY